MLTFISGDVVDATVGVCAGEEAERGWEAWWRDWMGGERDLATAAVA
jgi:hypothetical protein